MQVQVQVQVYVIVEQLSVIAQQVKEGCTLPRNDSSSPIVILSSEAKGE